jgi:hypothetical protein
LGSMSLEASPFPSQQHSKASSSFLEPIHSCCSQTICGSLDPQRGILKAGYRQGFQSWDAGFKSCLNHSQIT